MLPAVSARAEWRAAWTVVLAAAVGVGLGITGLPIYTTGLFIRPLEQAFAWPRATITGGLLFLKIGVTLMAPVVGLLVDRFPVRPVAALAMVGFALGYVGLTLNRGSVPLWYASWAALAVLGAGTSPIVWTRAVASWFNVSRGLALGTTLCGTGVVAAVGPVVVSGIIADYGWKAGFYALAAAQIVVGLPLVLLFLRARGEGRAGDATRALLPGMLVGEAFRTGVFWRLLAAFFLISVVVGGFIVNLPAMLADRGTSLAQAAQALGLMGVAIIVGRLTVGGLVDRFAVRVVAPLFILLPAASCLLLARGDAAPVAIILVGLAAGAEVDLLAYLIGHLFGMRHYARIYGWGLAAFSAGAGVGPGFAGWVHDVTGSYVEALFAFAAMIAVASALLATLRPLPGRLSPNVSRKVVPG